MPKGSFVLRVIFLLSTIVLVTDCCSSRILLLKEHTLKFVEDHRRNASSTPPPDASEASTPTSEAQYNYSSVTFSTTGAPFTQAQEDEKTTNPSTMQETSTAEDLRQTESTTEAVDLLALEETLENAGAATTWSSLLPPPVEDDVTEAPERRPPNSSSSGLAAAGEWLLPASSHSTNKDVAAPSLANQTHHLHHTLDIYYVIMRDMLLVECPGDFKANFCLNKGRCFPFPMGNDTLYSCECADGYFGERCESKSLGDHYVVAAGAPPTEPRILTARVVFSFPMLIAISALYLAIGSVIVFKRPARKKLLVQLPS